MIVLDAVALMTIQFVTFFRKVTKGSSRRILGEFEKLGRFDRTRRDASRRRVETVEGRILRDQIWRMVLEEHHHSLTENSKDDFQTLEDSDHHVVDG